MSALDQWLRNVGRSEEVLKNDDATEPIVTVGLLVKKAVPETFRRFDVSTFQWYMFLQDLKLTLSGLVEARH